MRQFQWLALSLLLCPAIAAAQQQAARECYVEWTGVSKGGQITTAFQTLKQASGKSNLFIGGGVDAVCKGTDQRLLSDSLEQYADQNLVVLIGNVHYVDAGMKLDSDRLTYWTNEERIVVEGRVRGITPGGTRFVSPRAEYLRPATGIRAQSKLTAEPRPTVWLSPRDAGEGSKDTVAITANRIISQNDSLVYAMGQVIIERSDLVATSDSAFVDNGREYMQLSKLPIVTGFGERQFTLVGSVIDTYSKLKKLERIRSSGGARAASEEVTLIADSIDLRLTEQKINRAYAWGPSRAKAVSSERDITADSIDIVMPLQELQEIRAVRGAFAASQPDTSTIIPKEPDWLRGDTITARFEPAAGTDSVKTNAVKTIVASGKARSFFQVAPSGIKGKTTTPNISYNIGRLITLDFKNRKVDNVTTIDKAEGFYLEANADSTRRGVTADSASKKPAPVKAPIKPLPAGKKP